MIPHFTQLTPDESAVVRMALVKSLGDKDSDVRLEAAEVIWELHDESSIPALESAIAIEPESFVRKAMQFDLERLQGKRP
jgi:HEAT repeat protein